MALVLALGEKNERLRYPGKNVSKCYWYFFCMENRNGIGLYHLYNTDEFIAPSRWEKGNMSTGIKFPPE